MEKFKAILNLVQKQQTTLSFGFVALFTVGGEHIFSSVVFGCPCSSWNFLYGCVFLLVPSLVLLLLGYLLSRKTWRLLTGCCMNTSKIFKMNNICGTVKVLVQITVNALVAPLTWVAVALLHGSYYECAMTGFNNTAYIHKVCDGKSKCFQDFHKLPCDGKSSLSASDREDVLLAIRAQSQVLGWMLIASIMAVALAFTCVTRCCSPISFLQFKFWMSYMHQENELFESLATEHAKNLAQQNVRSFFESTEAPTMETPDNKAWEKISALYKFSTKDYYYSTLHKYVESCGENHKKSRWSGECDLKNPSSELC
ncbi:calcium homeostasis modulator protein 6-like [Huso huso]|uniref:Calcium homeostasis modulator protein 6-like n=1 Tax=Huso huso TaxID=61971 RepID=A0ABR0ZXI8_HUSHU